MEITNTVITRSAIQKNKTAEYRADYIEENGKLHRVQCNIHKLPEQGELVGDFIGSVYLDRRTLSCSLPYSEESAEHFKAATDMIKNISKTTPLYDEETLQETPNNNQR